MKALPLFIYFILNAFTVLWGQSTQWGYKVMDFSSEYFTKQYSANQILGRPNVSFLGEKNPNAWTPKKIGFNEFIKIEYKEPIHLQQVAIVESYHPGALLNLYLYDESDKEYLIRSFTPFVDSVRSRTLTIFVDKTPYKVKAIKLDFDATVLSDYFSIDAVAISESDQPIKEEHFFADLLQENLITERLGKTVNSIYEEVNPVLSPDGKTLYFCRKNHPENKGGVSDTGDIWYSELRKDGTWGQAQHMGAGLNNTSPNFLVAVFPLSEDGMIKELILGNVYGKKGKMFSGISKVNNIYGTWINPTPLIIENYYNLNSQANYFISSGACKVMLLSIERKDTKGGKDLYVSFLKENNSWSEPRNLGNTINSAGDESYGFIDEACERLYFSSDGFIGLGKSDIYTTRRLDDTWTSWDMPENLGAVINTELNDWAFDPTSKGNDYVYFSRETEKGNADIYRIKPPIILDSIIIVKGKHVWLQDGLLRSSSDNP